MLTKITPFFMALLWCPLVVFANTSNKTTDAVFHIECPDDVTVTCDAEIWDLSAYGWAYVYGYGAPVPADQPVVSYHLNSCGSGHVTRTWTAYDYQNNPHTCTQYIYVGGGGFDVHNIHWPPTYMTPDCNADLDPDDLPAPYDYPTYDAVDCSMIMLGYDDLVFDFGGGCKKILRTWSLLDWCTYNPNYPHGGGRWDHTQVIKVKPTGDLLLTCPDDVMANAGPNCSGTYVSIPVASGTGACGGTVQVTNNSPYASNGGADASGLYPYGSTWVTFTAEDACGNWESCKVEVVVKDMKKPTPICYNGLTANLMMNSDGYYINLDAKWFNKSSFDNCTPEHLLTYRLEPSHFTCDQRGRQDVRMYVKDLDGNEQYCNTYVIIQDNMDMCPPIDTTTFVLSGQLTNVNGAAVYGMDIELQQHDEVMNATQSNASGVFQFSAMNSQDYMIVPRGNEEYALGLSTFDLLKLAKHIHGVKLLDLDAELLAADADQNNEVNIQDLLILRKLLLNYTSKLPNNRAWRFIPTDVLNGNDDNPMLLNYDENFQVSDLYENVDHIDFTAIKIGDINGSVQGLHSGEERNGGLSIDVKAVQNGNKIDFIATKSLVVSGFQLELNTAVENIISGKFNISMADTKVLENSTLISWFLIDEAVKISAGDLLYTVELPSSELINTALLNRVLAPELYSAGDIIYQLKLSQENNSLVIDEPKNEITLFPNPADINSSVKIVSGVTEIERVSILNSQGAVVFTSEFKDQTEVSIPTNSLSTGLHIVQVKTIDGEVKLEKIVLE